MITAVDTSVLLDVFTADPTHGTASLEALRHCLEGGSLVACEIVWAEVAAAFGTPELALDAMQRVGIGFEPLNTAASLDAGAAWRLYRSRGGTRARVIADFLIAAHAGVGARRLLTRDRGFFRTYFAELIVIDPTSTKLG